MLDFAEISCDDHVLEIGPGTGMITRALQKREAQVTAVEIDRRLIAEYGWIEGDILTYDIEQMKGYKIVSNLPFAITAPVLARFLPRRDCFTTLTLILQKELAERMMGKPMGRFSLLCQFYADVSYGFTISKNCFSPKPKVDAAAVQLTLKQPPDVSEKHFFELVSKAFQGRRKMIGKTLGRDLIAKTSLDPTLRPEKLTLSDFVKLAQSLDVL